MMQGLNIIEQIRAFGREQNLWGSGNYSGIIAKNKREIQIPVEEEKRGEKTYVPVVAACFTL